jgi:phosphatidylglycerophosphatase A
VIAMPESYWKTPPARRGARGPTSPPRPPRQGARGPLDWIAIVVGSVAFTGFAPLAPATVASAVVAVALTFVYPLPSLAAYVGVCVGLFVFGVWASTRLERMLGHDPSAATIDEALGMAITLAGVPITPATAVLAFVFFRFFDIVKLAPGRALERAPGGWGVMLDDACAGVYAALALRAVLWAWPHPTLVSWPFAVAVVAAVPLLVFRKPLARRYMKKRSRLSDARGGGGGGATPSGRAH